MTGREEETAMLTAIIAEHIHNHYKTTEEARIMGWGPRAIADVAGECMDTARIVKRMAEDDCNGALITDRQKRSADARVAYLATLFKQVNVKVKTGGDPRGFCFKLVADGLPYNSLGGKEEGYGVNG